MLAAAIPDDPCPSLAVLQSLENNRDDRLAGAARVARLLPVVTLTEDELAKGTALDAETSDYLRSIVTWRFEARAVECVRELAERGVADRLH